MDCSNPSVIKAKSERIPLHTVPRDPQILLGACGCVDAAKFGLLCQEFSRWAKVGVVVTKSSLSFIDTASFPKGLGVYRSRSCNKLLEWADIMVIAPLSANTLAKIAGRIGNDLLSNIVKRWDYKKPIYVAPTMHRAMLDNPLSTKHANRIHQRGITVIPPSKCKSDEIAAMPQPSEISFIVKLSHETIWK